MSSLLKVLERHFPTDISKIIISYIIDDERIYQGLDRYQIEKYAYYIESCKSWNMWWRNHRILNPRDRYDYCIESQEKQLKIYVDAFLFTYGL